jgi:hypothetical protein
MCVTVALIIIHSRTNWAHLHLDQTQIVIMKVTPRVDSFTLHIEAGQCGLNWVNTDSDTDL